jgi:hypothetical protein
MYALTYVPKQRKFFWNPKVKVCPIFVVGLHPQVSAAVTFSDILLTLWKLLTPTPIRCYKKFWTFLHLGAYYIDVSTGGLPDTRFKKKTFSTFYFTQMLTVTMRIKSQRTALPCMYVLSPKNLIRTHDLLFCWRRRWPRCQSLIRDFASIVDPDCIS